jgi:hypothetical protein
MKISRLTALSLSAAAILGVLASRARATGTCSTQNRDFADGNFVTLSCDATAATATKAKVGTFLNSSVRTLSVDLQTTCNSACSASVQGLNSSGQIISGCIANDAAADGVAVTLACPTMAKYRGDVLYK